MLDISTKCTKILPQSKITMTQLQRNRLKDAILIFKTETVHPERNHQTDSQPKEQRRSRY